MVKIRRRQRRERIRVESGGKQAWTVSRKANASAVASRGTHLKALTMTTITTVAPRPTAKFTQIATGGSRSSWRRRREKICRRWKT